MTTCSESGQVRKEAAIRSLCRASESIECAGVFWCRGYPRVPAGRLVSRWSSASPAGSLDYQAPCRHSRVADQNRLKGHIYLNNLIPCLLLLAGVVWSTVTMRFKRRRCCCLDFAVKEARFPRWGNGPLFQDFSLLAAQRPALNHPLRGWRQTALQSHPSDRY